MKNKTAIWMSVTGAVLGAAWLGAHWLQTESLRNELAQPVEKMSLPSSRPRTVEKAVPVESKARKKALPSFLPPAAIQVADASLPYRDRIAALKDFSLELAQADGRGLTAFLREARPEDKDAWQLALKNVVMDHLCASDAPGVRTLLADIFRDSGQNPVIRDYALQHLIEYAQLQTESGNRRGEFNEITEILWEAVTETQNSIAGTALLGLSRLSETRPEIDRGEVADTAWQLAAEDNTGDLARTTAIQVCASMNVTNALPAIRNLAQGGRTIPLQTSAIAALGLLDDTANAAWLRQLLEGDDDSLKPAARRALARMQENEHQRQLELKEQLERQELKQWKQKAGRI